MKNSVEINLGGFARIRNILGQDLFHLGGPFRRKSCYLWPFHCGHSFFFYDWGSVCALSLPVDLNFELAVLKGLNQSIWIQAKQVSKSTPKVGTWIALPAYFLARGRSGNSIGSAKPLASLNSSDNGQPIKDSSSLGHTIVSDWQCHKSPMLLRREGKWPLIDQQGRAKGLSPRWTIARGSLQAGTPCLSFHIWL